MTNKYAPKRTNKLIPRASIAEEIRYIDGSDDYYISESGKIYREYIDGMFYERKSFVSPACGYVYAIIVMGGKKKTIRVHKYVAQAFIPNPHNLPIVGHMDNNKTNNHYSNLYWTTWSENSQKAVKDGLLVNAKGEADSQSMPVVCLDSNMNFLRYYGSVTEAHKALGVSKSTILRQCRHEVQPKPRCGYWFEFKSDYLN